MITRRYGVLLTAAALLFIQLGCSTNWRTASRASSGIAPKPEERREALVHVYAARAINWRGWFAVHSWIAVKPKDAAAYTTYQLTGWRIRRGRDGRDIKQDIPDRLWFDSRPLLVDVLSGAEAESAIANIERAAADYPYPRRYRAWPGPNSNTFISHIIRRVPELQVELPPTAVGKDWLGGWRVFGRTESGTGLQLSLYGLLGISVGAAEGVEVNVLGLVFGVDFLRPALKLPLIGRLGLRDKPPPGQR